MFFVSFFKMIAKFNCMLSMLGGNPVCPKLLLYRIQIQKHKKQQMSMPGFERVDLLFVMLLCDPVSDMEMSFCPTATMKCTLIRK